jgi:hypothetical protein
VAHGKFTFRESDLKRLIRTVQETGLPVVRVELGPDGKIAVITLPAAEPEGRDIGSHEPAREIVL